MDNSAPSLSALRKQLGEYSLMKQAAGHGVFSSGHPALDSYLDGGFHRGQLHEVFAGTANDNGSAVGCAAMFALRAMRSGQPGRHVLWLRTLAAVRQGGRFSPGGFAELGGDPAALVMAIAADDTALLRSAADALRCDGFGAVIIECWGSPAILDLTATRRLTLAADGSGTTAFLLRLDARVQPSTASTRWEVRSAPSVLLEAGAPGYPTLDLTLLRRRGGACGKSWRVEWDRDAACFHPPGWRNRQAMPDAGGAAVSGAVVPLSSGEPDQHQRDIRRTG